MIGLAVLASSRLTAGPTIIRDNRIFDLAMTPVLGRGYSMSTNTFQSTCVRDVKMTEPSYDFQYTFQSMEDLKEIKQTQTVSGQVDISHLLTAVKARTSVTTGQEEKHFYHNIVVNINMDTYYASLDESKSTLGNSARNLLLTNDIPGFFHSCGTYYVRSLGRNARFVSVFTYTHDSLQRDKKFEFELELAIKGFGGRLMQLIGGNETQASFSTRNEASFSSLAEKKKLMITSEGWGLGKAQKASLISYDLKTFKEAIKDAFISMQNPQTGRVTTMEIVPWVENVEFQNFVKLDTEAKNEKGETLMLFEKKHILNLNAEFLARIERTDRKMTNIYYKALICRQIIDSRWKREGKFFPDLADAMIKNNRNETTITVTRLDLELTAEKIKSLLDAEEQFMYGPAGGAACMKEIMKEGVFKKSWRDIPVCRDLRSRFSAPVNEIIDDYCMPQLAKKGEK